jgi:hypothetical protein
LLPLSPATLVRSKPLEAVLTKPVYLTILSIGGLVFIAWGVLAFRSAVGDAFSLRADGHGLSVVMTGGVWFEAGALRLRALELRDSEGAAGAPSIASLGLLRDGCRVAESAGTGRGLGRGDCCSMRKSPLLHVASIDMCRKGWAAWKAAAFFACKLRWHLLCLAAALLCFAAAALFFSCRIDVLHALHATS